MKSKTSSRKPKVKPIPRQPINTGLLDFDEIQRNREGLELRPYQLNHLGFFLGEKRCIDRSDAGTGKTPLMCLWLYARAQSDRCIWTMPKSLMAKNYEELLLWSNLTPEQIVMVDGTPEQRKLQMDWAMGRVFIMGFDSFANNWEYLRSKYSNVVHLCGDEFHKGFSTHGSQDYRTGKYQGPRRTVSFYRYLQKGGDMLAATGTIINGRLTSAYPIIHAINPVYYGTYNTFLAWHCILDDWGNPVMWKNHDRIKTILDQHGRRVTFEEAYGSENKQLFIIACSMGTKQRKAYKEMEEKSILELDNGDLIEATQASVEVRRCLEIMALPEKFGIIEDNPNGKEARLMDEVETAITEGKQLLIFEPIKAAQYKWRDLLNGMGRKAEVMNGDVTGNARMWQDKNFKSGEISDLVCSPDVAGVGFNWGHIDTIIFMGLDYQDTTFIQNYRRAMRGVREKPLRVLVFQYRGSIDKRIAEKINAKSQDRLKVEAGTEVVIKSPSLKQGGFNSELFNKQPTNWKP